MSFNEMYRVLVKKRGYKRFTGTGANDLGITLEENIIHQKFYSLENAEALKKELQEHGFETKIVKGSK